MKKFFSSIGVNAKIAFLTIVCFIVDGLFNRTYAFAPGGGNEITFEGDQILDSVSNKMSNLGDALANVVQYGLLAGALVTLVLLVFNLLKGERESATKLGWWVFGLSFGFAAVAVIRSLITKGTA